MADVLVELSSSVVPPSAETILEQGRDDIGTESPRPPGAPNLGQRILGTSLFVSGHLMAWLGMKSSAWTASPARGPTCCSGLSIGCRGSASS